MPRWLLLIVVLVGCTLVPAVWVLGHTQSWRAALGAWRSFALFLLALAVPAIILAAVIGFQSP